MKASVSLKQGVDSCMVQAWDQGGEGGGESFYLYMFLYIKWEGPWITKATVQWPW